MGGDSGLFGAKLSILVLYSSIILTNSCELIVYTNIVVREKLFAGNVKRFNVLRER